MALGTSLAVGVAPALQASRRDLRSALQDGDRGSSGGGNRVRAALVFAEVALSTVLLMAAVLLARSFQHVEAVDPGFHPSEVLTVRLSLPARGTVGGPRSNSSPTRRSLESRPSPAFAPSRRPTSFR